VRRRAFALAACLLAGCATSAQNGKRLDSDFRLGYLAKSDIDLVAEAHQRAALDSLRLLAEKLYKRNPREWKKSGQPSAEAAVKRLFGDPARWDFAELQGRKGAEAVHLAFDEAYGGDRVLAFVAGLGYMVMASYEFKTEYYLPDDLDPQKLYNSARNVEIAAWKLANARTAGGELFLLANEAEGPVRNLSFEREFGKLIANQDILARIIAEKTNRSIVHVVQSLATAVFLPVTTAMK
jgi:hypothetical protein